MKSAKYDLSIKQPDVTRMMLISFGLSSEEQTLSEAFDEMRRFNA